MDKPEFSSVHGLVRHMPESMIMIFAVEILNQFQRIVINMAVVKRG